MSDGMRKVLFWVMVAVCAGLLVHQGLLMVGCG